MKAPATHQIKLGTWRFSAVVPFKGFSAAFRLASGQSLWLPMRLALGKLGCQTRTGRVSTQTDSVGDSFLIISLVFKLPGHVALTAIPQPPFAATSSC